MSASQSHTAWIWLAFFTVRARIEHTVLGSASEKANYGELEAIRWQLDHLACIAVANEMRQFDWGKKHRISSIHQITNSRASKVRPCRDASIASSCRNISSVVPARYPSFVLTLQALEHHQAVFEGIKLVDSISTCAATQELPSPHWSQNPQQSL